MLSVGKLADPDVAVPHRVAVILQRNRSFISMRLIVGYCMRTLPSRASLKHDVIVD